MKELDVLGGVPEKERLRTRPEKRAASIVVLVMQ